MKKIVGLSAFLFTALALFSVSSEAYANHAWGGYHWARTTTPFTLKLGDAVTSSWDTYLTQASVDWNASSVVKTTVVASSVSPRTCRATTGRVEVCNAKYGATGWLGIASIWADANSHITKGTVKLNDTYFGTATYNSPAWKRLVTCQEVAHTFGLSHQDENFNNVNLGSCMDYTNAPAGGIVGGFNYGASNEHPNVHDYDELVTIYSHVDAYTTFAASINSALGNIVNSQVKEESKAKNGEGDEDDGTFGKAIGFEKSGRANKFEKDIGNGNRIITEVFWLPQ